MPETLIRSPLMRLPEVIAVCNLSKSYLYRLMQQGKFPTPCIRRHKFARWKRTDIEAWLAKEMGEREAA